MKVLNFGSLNKDMVYNIIDFPKPGETISTEKYNVFCGGKGLNQSIALARAGVSIYHAGKISSDGKMLEDTLKQNGVNTDFVSVNGSCTGHAIIQVNDKGQNCIIVYGGSNKELTKGYIDFVLNNFCKDDMLILQNEVNLLDYIIYKAHNIGMKIVLNPSPIDDIIKQIDFNMIDWLILNEIEGEAITNNSKENEIIDILIGRYPKLKVILTLGEKGSMYGENNIRLKQAAFKTDVIDTTGAGDTFLGYFIAGTVLKKQPCECLKLAAVASSIAISIKGASNSIPYMQDVEKRSKAL